MRPTASATRTRCAIGDELGRLAHVRACGRRAASTRSPSTMRPGRGDITTMRVDRNTASGIECVTKTTVRFSRSPQLQQLLVEAVARDLVERAEGLVHHQQLAARSRARARSTRAAACRPTTATGTCPRSRSGRRAPSCSSAIACACRARDALDLQRQHDVGAARCATGTAPAPGTRSRRRAPAARRAGSCR